MLLSCAWFVICKTLLQNTSLQINVAMTKKDFTPTENTDREKGAEDWGLHHNETDRFPAEAQGIAEVDKNKEIKNAHASGDGSFGRSEGSLPEPENEEPKSDNAY